LIFSGALVGFVAPSLLEKIASFYLLCESRAEDKNQGCKRRKFTVILGRHANDPILTHTAWQARGSQSLTGLPYLSGFLIAEFHF
jgi:hypothetical protein